jgi:hypothetical protein
LAKISCPAYIKVIEALTILYATQLFSGQWIRGDVIIQLLKDNSIMVPSLDVFSFTEKKLKNAFSRTALAFIDADYTPNDTGIFRKMKYINNSNVSFFYFTLYKNSIPLKNAEWFKHAIHSKSELEYYNQRQSEAPTTVSDSSNISFDSVTHVEPVKIQQPDKTLNTEQQHKTTNEMVENHIIFPKLSEKISNESKWYSPEALSLFVKSQKVTKQKRKNK